MPVKLVGRTTDFSGKTLWEILGNLKNFGVGRLVKRNIMDRYPEPSYFKVLKVETDQVREGQDRKIWAYVEKVFRGRKYPKVVELYSSTYKADYRLVPRCEEQALLDRVAACKVEERILPKTIQFPPLLEYFLMEEKKSQGQPVVLPQLELKIKPGRDRVYRKAEDNESPTVEFQSSKQKTL
ncbi:uncharacterized protein LOC106663092 [Cimex lectularius]|uniref:Mitochondrial ribosomal protein S34 n=1 Tax=Cimex lectularius TaxID=79782 RepID=A0A8I6RBW9_CIMLE|nr:uncharacterized protein LOC106663092 [Cimex lectularius]